MQIVELETPELLTLKKLGEGSDGIVYKAGNGLLYKLYKQKHYITMDAEHMKKMYSPRIIEVATQRQSVIKNSTLPLGSIYINGVFKGCILKYHQGYIGIHNINILPKKLKIKILKQLVHNVKELTDHYIYHFDLSNKKIDTDHHSNVLISLKGNIEIIDLDGKSATYTDDFNSEYYQLTLRSLCSLIVDLLFDLDIERCTDEDINYIKERLIQNKIPADLASMIAYQNAPSYDGITEILDVANKTKILRI